jgi:hypothetical protein
MSRDRTTSNGRRRADERRVANGQLPKPSPKHLRCIAEANEPKDYERRATTAPSERARKEDHRQRPHKLRIKPNFTLDQAYVDMVMRQVGKANIATYIDERLHSGRGSTCSYRSQALISGLAISAHQLGSVRWTDVTKTLAAFPPQIRYYFGLTSMHVGENVDYRSASYRSVSRQVERLVEALDEGWVAKDGTACNLDWFAAALAKVNIPEFRLKDVTAVALDGTAWEARAALRTSAKKIEKDEAIAYGKLVAEGKGPVEQPIIHEGVIGTTTRQNLAGTKGLDGRNIYTADPDARGGYRTATDRHPNEYVGYESHLACAVGAYSWRGQPDKPGTVAEMPPYLLASYVTPAGWNPANAGLKVIEQVQQIAPNIDDVCADRGYTMKKPESFLRPLHAQGINVTMDYPEYLINKAEIIEVQSKGRTERFVMHAGTILHVTVPTNRRILDVSGDKEEVQARFNERARQFRWSSNGAAGGGSQVFKCPFCGGRAKNITLNPKTAALSNKVAPVDAPAWMLECCGGFMTVPVEMLDQYQKIPYGTTAHATAKGRRSGIESINNNLKTNEGFNRDFLAAFGLAAHRFAMAILVFVHNLELMMNDPDPEAATASTTHDWVDSEVGEDAEVCVTVLGEVTDEIGLPPPPT